MARFGILVVEKDKRVTNIVQSLFSAPEYSITQAACLENACSVLDSDTFDLIIVNANLNKTAQSRFTKQATAANPHLFILIIASDISSDSSAPRAGWSSLGELTRYQWFVFLVATPSAEPRSAFSSTPVRG